MTNKAVNFSEFKFKKETDSISFITVSKTAKICPGGLENVFNRVDVPERVTFERGGLSQEKCGGNMRKTKEM